MQCKKFMTAVTMGCARKNTRRRGWHVRHQPVPVFCETPEDRTLLSALSNGAYELLHQRVAENLGGFYVYKDAGSAFNHGELTLFSSQSPPITLVSVDANCISDPTSPNGCATDPATLDRVRGSVLHVHVDPLSTGQFAGIAITGTANVPTGINLTGATNLVFEARTSGAVGQALNLDIGGARVTRTIPTGTAFTTISIPLTSLAGGSVNLAHQNLLFAAGFSDVQARNGDEVFLDNIHYEPVPLRQQTEPTLPLSNQTFAVIPETRETIGSQHPIYPIDQVLVNTATVYEASMTAVSLLQRGQPQDLIDGRRIADAFVYALGHDLRRADGTPDPAEIQPIGDGSRGLHDAYQGGDLAAGPGFVGNAFPRQPSANGIAWEFTGQVVATMQFVDALYGETGFASQIQFYSNEMRRAQMLAPYGDGKGLVAATLDGENEWNSPFLPVDQVLTTPFQAIPERVALAATNWAIYVDLSHNFFLPQSSLPVITGPETLTPLQRPQVTWTPVSGAVSYDVWIRNQSTNVSPVILTTVSGTSYTPNVDLGIGKFNVWVRSTNAAGKKSAWTPQYNFQINTAVTLQPLDRQQNTARPTIHWDPLPGAVRYDLWIDNLTTSERQYVRLTNITGTSWTSPTDMPLGVYRAWVGAISSTGQLSPWSIPVNFAIISLSQRSGSPGLDSLLVDLAMTEFGLSHFIAAKS